MRVRHIIYAGFYLNLLAAGATAETTVTRGGSCHSAAGSFLLAANSGAIIRMDDGLSTFNDDVIVFRPREGDGWASRRLLSRFDLDVGERQTVRNSGVICSAPRRR